MLPPVCGILKLQQTSEYNKKKQIHRYREQTRAYQWGEGWLGQYRSRGKIGYYGIK